MTRTIYFLDWPYETIGGQLIGEREFDEEGFLLPEVVYGWPDISVLLIGRESGC